MQEEDKVTLWLKGTSVKLGTHTDAGGDRHTRGQGHPEALVPTATYLPDGVEGTHPLGTAVRQPVGDLAAAHQPLSAPEVTVFTHHPAAQRVPETQRDTDRETQVEDKAQVSEQPLPPPLSHQGECPQQEGEASE